MRKVTQEAARALLMHKSKSLGNTTVTPGLMQLHGNTIAIHDPLEGKLTIRDSGWRTVTTKERLNGILEVFKVKAHLVQRNHTWYVVNEQGYRTPWSGHLTISLEV